ncbi:hypothetical protein HanRHA438_Chr05g0234451 [Helianthus annuus]|nr:hypothetical protein HanRHA438_Chr05g0234451 [Helianthus annuus]
MVDDMALVDWIVGVMESITSDSTPNPLIYHIQNLQMDPKILSPNILLVVGLN